MANGKMEDQDVLFTFRVGPKKQIFQIEKRMVVSVSPVFDRMMNGDMKESQELSADLPEVDAMLFTNFLEYARRFSSQNSSTLTDRQEVKQPLIHTHAGILLVLMIDNGITQFPCCICEEPTPLYLAKYFPLCSSCSREGLKLTWGPARCVACRQRGYIDCLFRTLCADCMTKHNLRNSNHILPPKSTLSLMEISVDNEEDVGIFRFDVPLLAENILACTEIDLKKISIEDLSLHKLVDAWIFGDTYGIKPYRKLAALTLFRKLACEQHEATELVNVTSHIYRNTVDSGLEVTLELRNPVRRMMACYFAYHGSHLQSSLALARLFCSGTQFPHDYFLAATKIAEGKIGKGWVAKREKGKKS